MIQTTNSLQLINKLFEHLDKWRKFPAYQLERRADIFFSIYLEHIIKEKFGTDVTMIIPEFPLKNDGNNMSSRIDYLIICEEQKQVFLLELKTDKNSLRPDQDIYLKSAKHKGINQLVTDILIICEATQQKIKYKNIIKELIKAGWLNHKIEPMSDIYNITIVYILPEENDKYDNVISFDYIVSKLSDYTDELTSRFVTSLLEWRDNPNTQ